MPRLGWGSAIVAVASLSAQLPPNTVMAASEVGYVGASALHVDIIDLVGLNNPEIAHHGFQSAKLFSQRPDLIWLPPADYAFILREIVCNPELYRSYDYYPGLFDYGMAVNMGSPHYSQISSTITDTANLTYQDYRLALSDAARHPPAECGALMN